MHTGHYTALQGMRLSIPHCYYNGNVAIARGVCALESSSYCIMITQAQYLNALHLYCVPHTCILMLQ